LEIRHRASLYIAAIIGGCFFIWFSLGIMLGTGEFHILIALVTAFGCAFSFLGVYGLFNRKHDSITISEHGITYRKGERGFQIHVSDIDHIQPWAGIGGRGVTLKLKSGKSVTFDCRSYCSPKNFIKYCKNANLPCA